MKQTLIAVLLAAALLFAACGTDPSAPLTDAPVTETEPNAPQNDDEEAPQASGLTFSAEDLFGTAVDSSVFSEYDLVLLNFWAYWCGPCVQELPHLQRLSEEYPNVLILGVVADPSDMAETKRIVTEAGVTYPVLLPSGDLLPIVSKILYLPTSYFCSPEGELLSDPIIGANSYEGWKAEIDEYLKELGESA